jgi:hypothetical protein
MFSELALGVWSGVGVAWWILAWWLVEGERKLPKEPVPLAEASPAFLSIFKPLALLTSDGLQSVAPGLKSFVAQLDSASELLLGVHEANRSVITPFTERLRTDYPEARLKVVFRSDPDEVANPKIAWQKILAPHAEGELWLWSDADIVAPPDFLHRARAEFTCSGAGLLTFPYVVREILSPPALFDALYVNVEFYPGVLLLRKRGPVDFGLGAGMLFRRDDFLRQLDWLELGAALADDFMLGQKLQPVRLSRMTLVTSAQVSTWRAALLHHLRWSKSVFWSRPGGSAARIAILPLLGWIIYLLLHLARAWAWLGLFAMMQVDVFFAAWLCRRVGCRWTWRDLPATEAWSVWRAGVWLACWLPWPVVWQKRRWWGPHAPQQRSN